MIKFYSHVLSKEMKRCARMLLTAIMKKLNEQNEEEAEAVCEPMQSSDDDFETQPVPQQ
jgi:hypothetical protein